MLKYIWLIHIFVASKNYSEIIMIIIKMHSKIVFVKFQLICRRQNEGFLQKGQVQFLSMYTDMKPVTPHARTL